METSEQVARKARQFFLSYFHKLANDLNTLTAAPVVCSLVDVSLLRGGSDLDTLFDMDRSVAYVKEDGLDTGDVHLIFDITTSIALTGLMMMMGESVIEAQVKKREYNEEIQEGFQEVSNQVVGAMNDLVEEKMADGGHLILEDTTYAGFGELPKTLSEENTYLCATVDIKVSNFPNATANWLLSKELAEVLLGVQIEGTAAEEAKAEAKKAPPPPAEPEEIQEAETAFEGEEEEEESGPAEQTTAAPMAESEAKFAQDNLPMPDEPGGIKTLMTEIPFSLKEDEKIMRAITAMRQDGYRYIGVERQGRLLRVVSQSDLRQIMGPFFGTKAMNPRDKAICTVPIGKLNQTQKTIYITVEGTINQAADLFIKHDLRALPVLSNKGVLRGFVPVHATLDYFRRKKQVR